MSNETTNPVWRAVLRIPSRDLTLIQSENDLLAGYKWAIQSVYAFAIEVNKICVKFFKENSLHDTPEKIFIINTNNLNIKKPESHFGDFESFNESLLSFFGSSSSDNIAQPTIISEQSYFKNEKYRARFFSDLTDMMRNDTDYNQLSDILDTLYSTFQKAEIFYNKICLPFASLTLQKQYEKLNSYFKQNSFDVFAEFDLDIFYLVEWSRFSNQKQMYYWENDYKYRNEPNRNQQLINGYGNKCADTNCMPQLIDLRKTISLDSNNVQFFVENSPKLLSEIIIDMNKKF